VLHETCVPAYGPFVTTLGARIFFSLTVSNSLLFYIMNQKQFDSTSTACVGGWPALFEHLVSGSYSTTWTAPGNGTYFWLLSTGLGQQPAQYSLSLTSTVLNVSSVTLMETSTSTYAQPVQSSINETPTASPPFGVSTTEMSIIAGIVVCLAGLGYFGYRLGRKKI
jgi:hypothetical protein